MAVQPENHPPISITKSISVCSKELLDHTKSLKLSNLDRQCPTLMYLIFFYKSSPSTNHEKLCFGSAFDRLKSGLEATLSIWYPAAGRLMPNSDDGKLNIWCNNNGAVLVQAVTQHEMSQLGDLSSYNDFYENLAFKPVISDGNITEMPLVTAQITKFACGGYSIGVGTSHSLFDGVSAYDFLRAWAARCNMKLPEGSELYKPVHERGNLLLENYENSKELNNSNPAIDHLYQMINQANANEAQDLCVIRTFHLRNEMIENLKKKVLGDENFSCSTFELVAAHLWKVRTKVLGLERERMVCLQFAVDARNRLVPPMPKGFSGNAYVLASVTSTARELEEESYRSIIERIKEAKNSVTHDYVNAYIKALESPAPATLPPVPELTIVSNWTRVPFHTINFLGEEAAYASPLIPPIPQVAYFMQNPSECKSIHVRIGLLPKVEAAFTHGFINMYHY